MSPILAPVGFEAAIDVSGRLGGEFRGGPGADHADQVELTGVFHGGRGKDSVSSMRGGRFLGGPAPDTVERMSAGAVFNGARGNDQVTLYTDGSTFHGGVGIDSAKVCWEDNTLTGVEIETPAPVCPCSHPQQRSVRIAALVPLRGCERSTPQNTLNPSGEPGGVGCLAIGEPRRIRTFNLVIKSHLLYR